MRPETNASRPQPTAEYWRARAEELERHLTESRALLMRLAEMLPVEYLSRLKLSAAELVNDDVTGPNFDSASVPDRPKSMEQVE